jgi:hypothetical protein
MPAVNASSQPQTTAGPSWSSAIPEGTAAWARLAVQVRPKGAQVFVDGFRTGATPISLQLSPGHHQVAVELEGFAPLTRTVDLAAGAQLIIDGHLVPLLPAVQSAATVAALPGTPKVTGDEPSLRLADLTIRSVRIELPTGASCAYTSTQLGLGVVLGNGGTAPAGPFVVEANGAQQRVETGLAAGQVVRVWFAAHNVNGENRVLVDALSEVEEANEGNNRFAQMVPIPTLPPTCTPQPAEPTPQPPVQTPQSVHAADSPLPVDKVSVRESSIGIPTYPYAAFISQAWSEPYRIGFPVLDWAAYETSGPSPSEVVYRSLLVENDFLQLLFLPDLGGRLYEIVFKPTGHHETYRNPVLKPTRWGPLEQGWWLAAGGFEWCLPVAEHGYEWGTPWIVQVAQDQEGVTVNMRDTQAGDRVRAQVAVRLEADAAYLIVQPRLENPTTAPVKVKYWTNAMLAPGGHNAPSADLRFVLSDGVKAVTVHSRGDETLPDYGEHMPWPVFAGVDLSRLGNWNRWLGFFADLPVGGFIAAYDEKYDEGMVRLLATGVEGIQGAKVFGLGWGDPIPAGNWTDDGSSYIELHGGPSSTFDDSVTLAPGGTLQWREIWYPVAGLGSLDHADELAAMHLAAADDTVRLAVATNRPWAGNLVLLVNKREQWRSGLSLVPGQAFKKQIKLGSALPATGDLALRLVGSEGTVMAEYAAELGPE